MTNRLWIIALYSNGTYTWDGCKVHLRGIDGAAKELGVAFTGEAARRIPRDLVGSQNDSVYVELPFTILEELPLRWCLIYKWDGRHQVIGVGGSKEETVSMALETGIVRNAAAIAYLKNPGVIPERNGTPAASAYTLTWRRIDALAAQAAYDHLTEQPRVVGWVEHVVDDEGVVRLGGER